MTNQEFSDLAMEVLKKAKSLAKKEAKKRKITINEKDFEIDIMDNEYGQKVEMWFFSDNQLAKEPFNCTYYIKGVHSGIKNNQFKD